MVTLPSSGRPKPGNIAIIARKQNKKPCHDAAISQNSNTPHTKYKGHNIAISLPSCCLPHPIVERKQNVDQLRNGTDDIYRQQSQRLHGLTNPPPPIRKAKSKSREIIREKILKINRSPHQTKSAFCVQVKKDRKNVLGILPRKTQNSPASHNILT